MIYEAAQANLTTGNKLHDVGGTAESHVSATTSMHTHALAVSALSNKWAHAKIRCTIGTYEGATVPVR